MKRKQTQRRHEICCYPQLIKASGWSLGSGFSGVLGRARPPVKLVGVQPRPSPGNGAASRVGLRKRKWRTPWWESCEGERHGHQTGRRIALPVSYRRQGTSHCISVNSFPHLKKRYNRV